MKKVLFVVFPYIKTSKSIELFGLDFRSNKDLENISSDIKKHLKCILKMFYLKNNLQFTDMIFLYKEYDTIEEKYKFLIDVDKAQKLINYIYSAPHPKFLEPFIDKEHFDFYVFEKDRIPKSLILPDQFVKKVGNFKYPVIDKTNHLEGYSVRLNNRNNFFAVKGSKIYPSNPSLGIRYYQDLFLDFSSGNSKILELCKRSYQNKIFENEDIQNRIFSALRWYNLSLSLFNNEDIKLLNLAIALETLLALENNESLTKRFKESIKLLVGNINDIDIWLEQFYKVRSNIVHDGYLSDSTKLMFCKSDKYKSNQEKIYYRTLVSYGRIIFSICFNAILSGLEMTYRTNLSQLFKTNYERFHELCIFLSNIKKFNKKEINLAIEQLKEIEEYQYVQENNINYDEILSCIKNISLYLNKNTEIPKELSSIINLLSQKIPKKDEEQLYYNRLHAIFETTNIMQKNLFTTKNELLLKIFFPLIDISSRYLMNEYFAIEAKLRNNSQC